MMKRKTSMNVDDTSCPYKQRSCVAADGICDQRGFRGGFHGQDAECINTCPACRDNQQLLITIEIDHVT